MYNKTDILTKFNQLVGYKEQDGITLSRQTSGLLTIGETYIILDYVTGDEFVNCGAANVTGSEFVATNTTPTVYTNLSVLQNQKLLVSNSYLYVNDISGILLENIQKSRPTEDVSTYLENIYNSTVIKLVDNFISKAKKYLDTKALRVNQPINSENQDGLITQNENFIGYFIELNNSNSLKMIINSIALQVNKAQTVRIFLYDLSKKVAVETMDISCTDFDKDYNSLIDWTLMFKTLENTGSKFLIGFYEYNSTNPETWQLDSDSKSYSTTVHKHYDYEVSEITPILINKNNFNYNAITGTYDLPEFDECIMYNGGYSNVFFNYTIEADYTNLIIDTYLSFAISLQYTLALKIINDCYSSNSFNAVQNSNKDEYLKLSQKLILDLNGFNIETKEGVGYSNGLIQDLIKEFENIDKILFPLKRTIKF